MKILEIKNLCKVYGSGDTRVDALKNISFDIEGNLDIDLILP